MDVDDHLPGLHGRLARLGGGEVGVEVEGELVAGEVAGGDGAAYVEGLGAAEGGELFGDLGDGGVEVEGVGEVELGVEVDGAVVGDLVGVEVEVPGVGGVAAALVGGVGVVAGPGFLDGAVELGVGELVGDRGEVAVHEPAPSMGRDRVAWAILRAFHTGTRRR